MVARQKLTLYEYRLPVNSPRWKVREGLILETEQGWGEIAPLPGLSRESLAEARAEVLRLWPNLSQATLPSVRFGFASAQKPLRSVRIPLAALSEPRSGFTTLKLKIGHLDPLEAIELVHSYKGRYRLRLDINRLWTLEQALTFIRPFQPSDFEYLEEPVSTFAELVQFSELTRFPLAIDESFSLPFSRLPSLKAVVIKPTVVGFIPSLPPHLDLILSSSYETGLGLLHIAHLVSSPLPQGLDTYRALKEDILTHPIDCSAGYFSWKAHDPPIDVTKLCPIAL